MEAIFQEHREKKKDFESHVRDIFEITIPEEMTRLIFLFKESPTLVEQVEQKFRKEEKLTLQLRQNEEQPLQLNPHSDEIQPSQLNQNKKISTYLQKIIKYVRTNPRQTTFALVFIPILFYSLIKLLR